MSTCCAVSAHGLVKHSLNISLSKHRQKPQIQNTASREWKTSCLYPRIYFGFNCPEIFPLCFLEFCINFLHYSTHTLHSMLQSAVLMHCSILFPKNRYVCTRFLNGLAVCSCYFSTRYISNIYISENIKK